jgi:MFS family permease
MEVGVSKVFSSQMICRSLRTNQTLCIAIAATTVGAYSTLASASDGYGAGMVMPVIMVAVVGITVGTVLGILSAVTTVASGKRRLSMFAIVFSLFALVLTVRVAAGSRDAFLHFIGDSLFWAISFWYVLFLLISFFIAKTAFPHVHPTDKDDSP